MPNRTVYLNGRFVPEREARISIYDSAVLSGDMAFDSTRTFQGEPFELAAHFDRLFGTLEALQIDCRMTKRDLESVTWETLEKNRPTETDDMEWQIIHNISPGIGEPYRAAFSEAAEPTVCISCWPLLPQLARISPFYEQGVRLVIPSQRAMPPRLMDPHAKSRSRVHAKLAQLQAGKIEPGSWPLLLDENGYLAEGTAWNIFVVRNGRLLTPTTRNVLPGVSRTITLQLAEAAGMEVQETDLTPDEAHSAEEMFCTATSFCVLPVQTFEGQAVGARCPGPVTERLSQAWREHIGVDFIAQARAFADRLPAWQENERAATW